MTRRILAYLFIFSLATSLAVAQQPGSVVLSLDQYEGMRQKSELPAPPYAYVLSLSDYQAEVQEQALVVRATFHAVLYTDQPTVIPLFKEGVTVDRASVGEEPAVLAADNKGEISWALLGKPGEEKSLELEFRLPVRQEEGFYHAGFAIPPSGVGRLTVDFPYAEVQARLNDQHQPIRPGKAGHSLLQASIGGREKIALQWLPLSKDVQPHLALHQTLFIDHAGHGFMNYRTSMKLRVSRRPIEGLSIPLEWDPGSVSIQGKAVAGYEKKDKTLRIRFKEPLIGNTELVMSCSRFLKDEEQVFTVVHFIPNEANQVSGQIAFARSDLYRMSITAQDNIQAVPVDQLSEFREAAAQAFSFWNSRYQLEYTLEQIVPEFSAALYNSISFGETTCLLGTRGECTVSQGALHSFDLSLPPGFQLEAVTGNTVRDWSLLPEGKGIRVVLRRAEKAKAIFSLNFRRNYESEQAIAIELPEIADAKRIRGFVSVSPQSAVRVVASNQKGLEALDPGRVPASMKGDLDVAPLLAYRYLAQPAALTLTPERFEKAEVETTRIEKMLVALKFASQNTLQTQMVLNLRNTDADMLAVEVPGDISIRKCEIDGFSIEPALGEKPGTLLFPAPKSRTKITIIDLEYLSSIEPLGRGRKMELPIPKVSLPIDELGLLLSVPEGYEERLPDKGLLEPSKEMPVAQIPEHLMDLEWLEGPIGRPQGAPKEVQDIVVALETYYIDNNAYPPTLNALTEPVVHLKDPSPRFWEKYKYDTNYLATWRLGYEDSLAGAKQTREVPLGTGSYYKAVYLRGDKAALRNLLTVRAEIRKAKAGFNYLALLLVAGVVVIAAFAWRKMVQ